MKSQETFIEKQEANLSIHIFTVSATLVGACLTVIGIVNIISVSKKAETIVDDILAFDAILFLIACVLSYFAIKTEHKIKKLRTEKIADLFFLSALALMALCCFSIVVKW